MLSNMGSGNNWSVVGLEHYASDDELAKVRLFEDYPDALLYFASACCVFFMIVGIPGNLITIIALARCKKVRNATAYFIMNLSLSDLMMCCFNLPLAASTFGNKCWAHGKFLCMLFALTRYALVAISIFSILAITINRYMLMSHPSVYIKIYKKKYIVLMIISIWLFSFGVLLPTWFEFWGRFSLNHISCSIITDKYGTSPKKAMFITAFMLPTLAIIVCYARILWIVKQSSRQSKAIVPRKSGTENTYIAASPIIRSSAFEGQTTVVPKKEVKITLNCFLPPELSSNYDSSSPDDLDKKCNLEVKPRTFSIKAAKRIRQSFLATIRRPTATRGPPMPTRKDKKLRTMIAAILLSFFVCHLPITITKSIAEEFTSIQTLNIISYILINMTTCINPIVYVVMSNEYRQAYKSVFKCGR